MIYSVNYSIKDVEAYKAAGKTLPLLVVAETFDSALKTAKKFENDNASLLEVKIFADHNAIVVARGYEGLTVSKDKENGN